MSDYINRKDVIKAINSIQPSYIPKTKQKQQGEWLVDIPYEYLKCSVCSESVHLMYVISGGVKYCPNCGARMNKYKTGD